MYTTHHQVAVLDGAPLYQVHFRIRFPTIVGQDLGVIGELPELGNWDPKKCLKLKWFEDHIWESEVPLLTTRPFFKYKYVMYNPTQTIEQGMDRLAELRLLSEIKNRGIITSHYHENYHYAHAIHVELNDEWETFRVQYTVWHPDDVHIRVTGSRPEFNEQGTGSLAMHRAANARAWMQNQYGSPMRPF